MEKSKTRKGAERIRDLSKRSAFQFVMLLSFVSLFADMTYESARSITGPWLAILGANAAIVGFVAGLGELIGYTLRIVSGYLADTTRKYWALTLIGYLCNLLAVPLLALAEHWWLAAFLIVMERTGKAIRVPPRDAMLSHAGQKMGMGWVFGLHEAIDQIGAMLGPLMIALVLYFKGGYRNSFAFLLIPALLALLILARARWLYPSPQHLEQCEEKLQTSGMKPAFWVYLAGASLIAAGYTDFPLMAYHFHKNTILSPVWIPVSYALAMGLNAISAPLTGYFYDRKGFWILILVTALFSLFAPLVFFGGLGLVLTGIGLWSIGVSAQESLMQAIVGNMVPARHRGSSYGVFNAGYGVCWFVGSVIMGILYDYSIGVLVIFSLGVQLLALPVLWKVWRM